MHESAARWGGNAVVVGLVAGVMLLLGLVVTAVAVDRFSSYTVSSPTDLHRVQIGFPMTAVTQDQSSLTRPAYPSQAHFEGPWTSPTHIDAGGLLVDATAAAACLAALAAATSAVGIRVSRVVRPARRRSTATA